MYASTGPESRCSGATTAAGSSRFSEKASASGSGWKTGAWKSRAGAVHSASPAQARIQALSRASVRSRGPVWARSRTIGQLITASSTA